MPRGHCCTTSFQFTASSTRAWPPDTQTSGSGSWRRGNWWTSRSSRTWRGSGGSSRRRTVWSCPGRRWTGGCRSWSMGWWWRTARRGCVRFVRRCAWSPATSSATWCHTLVNARSSARWVRWHKFIKSIFSQWRLELHQIPFVCPVSSFFDETL